MTTFEPNELYSLVIDSCAQKMRNAGFARRGTSLQKKANENVAIIDFQKSTRSNTGSVLFTINLGIICGLLLDIKASAPKKIGITHAHLRQRVGIFLPDRPDKWWTIEPETDANSLIEEILSLIEREAAPYLDRYLNDNALVALWESGQSPGLTKTQRLQYLIRLNASKESGE